jgi:signal transduction histidine kinase
MDHMQSEMQRRDEDAQLFSNLFKQGMLATNDQGNITVVNEPAEQERIAISFS